MSIESYRNFLTNMGHTVRKVENTYWFDVHPRVYMSLPYHAALEPRHVNVKQILGSDGIALRYPCAVENGRESFRLACYDKDFDLQKLSSNNRSKTRRGITRCQVAPISFDDLEVEGPALDKETKERQGRKTTDDVDRYWSSFYKYAKLCDCAESWAAYVEGELAAYLISIVLDGCANVLILRSRRSLLKHYPNNALIFTYLQHTLQRDGIELVSYGLEPIQGTLDGLEGFKLGMGSQKHSVGQRVELSPFISPWLKGPLISGAQHLAVLRKNDERLSKFAGMLEWYKSQPAA